MSDSAFQNIHVVINPAAGKDEPILNVLNDVFHRHQINWSVSITKKYGDAQQQARAAALAGADLVAGYGGDGTQHEVANGILGTNAVLGVLPGGTGNGFATELGIPKELPPAVNLLCSGHQVRRIDVVQLGDTHFIQRLYTGIEPEAQTSREDKDKYGLFAYVVNVYHRAGEIKNRDVHCRITIDGRVIDISAAKIYVVNAARAGTGFSITGAFSKPDDGMVDIFVLDNHNLRTIAAAAERMVNLPTEIASRYIWRGREVTIETDPDQPVWTDGEFSGRTPVAMKVIPGALRVVAPK